ncbi:MAG: hypothetical protein V3T01_04310, partial [Myxococcota bacterium]
NLDFALGDQSTGPLNLTNLSVGTHQLTASVTDSLGLPGNAFVTFTIVANAPPTVLITSPPNGGSAAAGTSVNLVATANDPEDGNLTAAVVWTSDLDGVLGAGPGGSLTLTNLSVGAHQLTASVIDSLGLPGNAFVTFTIVANAPPTVLITSPPNGGSATAGTPVDLVATANDAEDGNLTAFVIWTSDLDGVLGAGPGGSLTLTNLSIGAHQLTASVTDSLGLAGNASVTFTIPEPAAAASSVAALAVVFALAAVRKARTRTDALRT